MNQKTKTGTGTGRAITQDCINSVKKMRDIGLPSSEIARYVGVGSGTISTIIRGGYTLEGYRLLRRAIERKPKLKSDTPQTIEVEEVSTKSVAIDHNLLVLQSIHTVLLEIRETLERQEHKKSGLFR